MSKPLNTFLATSMALALGTSMVSTANAAVIKSSSTTKTTKTTPATTKTTKTIKVTKTTKATQPTAIQTSTPATLPPMTPTTAAAPITAVTTGLSEPSLSTVTYPKYNSVAWNGTDLAAQNLTQVPMPTMTLNNINMLPTVVIPQDTQDTSRLDVTVFDDFIAEVSPKARHYPPVFINSTERYNATQRVKQLSQWINGYAQQPNASYDILLRAAKINAIGRNLDLGSDYAVNASNFIARAIGLNDTAEANFIYGVMLAEGGGFAEGSKYLEKAERMGYAEATQSLAQADLLDDKKQRAIERLNEFKAKYPNDPYIDEQLRIVNRGEYYIWKLPAQLIR